VPRLGPCRTAVITRDLRRPYRTMPMSPFPFSSSLLLPHITSALVACQEPTCSGTSTGHCSIHNHTHTHTLSLSQGSLALSTFFFPTLSFLPQWSWRSRLLPYHAWISVPPAKRRRSLPDKAQQGLFRTLLGKAPPGAGAINNFHCIRVLNATRRVKRRRSVRMAPAQDQRGHG